MQEMMRDMMRGLRRPYVIEQNGRRELLNDNRLLGNCISSWRRADDRNHGLDWYRA